MTDLAWGTVRSFSQFGEDLVLQRLFRNQPTGFFVDVGAYDPYQASNTTMLYRSGWRGINIEPDPTGHARLKRHRPRDINLELAVASEAGQARFIRAGLVAGLDLPGRLWSDGGARKRADVTVDVRPLSDILDDHLPPGQQIDLLDVDCEGHDLDVLHSNDWARYRPKVLLVECHTERSAAIEALLVDTGYRLYERLHPSALFIEATADLNLQ
jgi:FkbM family methyltransferase